MPYLTDIDPANPTAFVDLRPFWLAVVSRWLLVLGIILLVEAISFTGLSILRRTSPVYQAQVTLLLTGSRYQVTFDPKIASIDSLPNLQAAANSARAQEYQTIAQSAEVREGVSKRLPDVSDAELNGSNLTMHPKGALLVVSASSAEPARATMLAQAYAASLADRLDAVYGPTASDEESLQRALVEAKSQHEDANNNYINFLKNSKIDMLAIQIKEKQTAQSILADHQTTVTGGKLASAYRNLVTLEAIQNDGRSLQQQLMNGALSPAGLDGARIALLMLQSRLASLPGAVPKSSEVNMDSMVTPIQIQLPLGTSGAISQNALLGDVNHLIEASTASVSQNERIISEVSAAQLSTDPDTIQQTVRQLGSQITTLQSELAQEQFQKDQLEAQVKATGATQSALETKLQEAGVTLGTSTGKAIVLAKSDTASVIFPPPLSRTLLLMLPVGLIIGILSALLLSRRDRRGDLSKTSQTGSALDTANAS